LVNEEKREEAIVCLSFTPLSFSSSSLLPSSLGGEKEESKSRITRVVIRGARHLREPLQAQQFPRKRATQTSPLSKNPLSHSLPLTPSLPPSLSLSLSLFPRSPHLIKHKQATKSSFALAPAALASSATCSTSASAAQPFSWQQPQRRSFASAADAPAARAPTGVPAVDARLSHLADKDVWDEAWAYEPRFGTESDPIVVPALLSERIIGVTDPDDDTLVIWGVVREGEPPKQLVPGGEFFSLKRVAHVDKVGDVLGIAEAKGGPATMH
jgi:cytochrome c oxidase subunit 5b